MQLIYIHGLNSDASSIKGQWLADWCQQRRPEVRVVRPDLNLPPHEVLALLDDLIAQDPQTALVGSSLGGFFATVCVARHGLRAVLLNPSVRPFISMQRFFKNGESSHVTDGGWVITPSQLDDLHGYFNEKPVHADRLLVLLKQGDEVLDYRQAEAYYSQDGAQATLLIEPDGDHFMTDMQDKIPLMMDFLFGFRATN